MSKVTVQMVCFVKEVNKVLVKMGSLAKQMNKVPAQMATMFYFKILLSRFLAQRLHNTTLCKGCGGKSSGTSEFLQAIENICIQNSTSLKPVSCKCFATVLCTILVVLCKRLNESRSRHPCISANMREVHE